MAQIAFAFFRVLLCKKFVPTLLFKFGVLGSLEPNLMKKLIVVFLCVLLVSTFSLVDATPVDVDTIRITTYNTLNFPDAMGEERIEHFRVVMNEIHPDIVVCQEITKWSGARLFLDSVMNYETHSFDRADFNLHYQDIYNSLFYRTSKVVYDSVKFLPTGAEPGERDVAEYYLKTIPDSTQFRVLSVHLKASMRDSLVRFSQATILRNHLDSCEIGTNFLVVGDFNIYYSNESAFRKLTDSLENNNGRLWDPLNTPGNWHENEEFASIHTQSTRWDNLPDGGAGGGLDDRFDMILCSKSFLENGELYLLADTYTAFGNDGNHFDQSINSGTNTAVPSDVADALYYASDHLPVYVDIEVEKVGIELANNQRFSLYNYPNPFNSKTTIEFTLPKEDKVTLEIYDITGQKVQTLINTTKPEGLHRVTWDSKNDAAQSVVGGVYFCRIVVGDSSQTKKIVLLH